MFCSQCGALLTETAAFCAQCGLPRGAAPPTAPAVPSASPQTIPPAMTPVVSQPVATAPAGPTNYAGFWLRFVAYLIDSVVLSVPMLIVIGILVVLYKASFSGDEMSDAPNPGFIAIVLFSILAWVAGIWLYYAVTESSSWQGTLGKKVIGLYVTDMQGRRLSFGHASGRFFSKIITGMIPLAIGYIMAGFTERKQALHDMIAGCLVLRKA